MSCSWLPVAARHVKGVGFQQVTHLVEAPNVLLGDFNPNFLRLPRCASQQAASSFLLLLTNIIPFA